jgi:hypothetical protein
MHFVVVSLSFLVVIFLAAVVLRVVRVLLLAALPLWLILLAQNHWNWIDDLGKQQREQFILDELQHVDEHLHGFS